MNMNIYQHEFKMNLKSVVVWSVSITILLVAFMSFFSSFAADAELLNEMMDKFPKELLMAFGMTDMDMATVLGYFGLIFLFCQICLAIQAANYGVSLVSIEERELTADFLLAKPVGRTQILTSKLLAAISSLTITNIVTWIASFISVNIFRHGRDYDARPLVLLLLSIVLFQLFFLSVGMVISLLVKRVRSVTPYSMALAFGLYVLNAFAGMIGGDSLEIISPYKHFEPNYIINHAAYNLPLVLLSVAVIIVSITASYVLYSKRNMLTPV
jgi:ABC-2 type transport system permease protein